MRARTGHVFNLDVAPRQGARRPKNHRCADNYVIVFLMRLADQIAQCRTPFIVENTITKQQLRLTGAADFSEFPRRLPNSLQPDR